MAQHDPVQDEINRQIRRSIAANRPGLREVAHLGTVEGNKVLRDRPDLRAEIRRNAGVEAGINAQDRIVREREAAEKAAADAASKRLLADRTGQAKLATANAALATARTGADRGTSLSQAAAEGLGISDLAGKVSPTTARAISTRKTSQDRLRREDERIKNARTKESNLQKQRNKQFELSQIKEARFQTEEQVKIALEGTEVPEETQKKISFIVSQALSKLQDEEVPPEVVDELFNEALGETFGDRKKAAVLAKKRARERGFFVPE